jgi:RNA polymerase sigma-70 factor (ECF subfamily)
VAFSLDEPLLAEEGEVGRQLADPAPSVDEHVQSLELGRQVEQAMRALPEFHRAVLVLHDMQGLKYEEIAQIMGCSLGTVKSRLFYARRKLGTMLGDYLVG